MTDRDKPYTPHPGEHPGTRHGSARDPEREVRELAEEQGQGQTVDPAVGLRVLEAAKDDIYEAFRGQGDSPASAVATAIIGYQNALREIDRLRAFLDEREAGSTVTLGSRELEDALHRALGEVGRLSRVIEDAFERGDLRMNDFEEDPLASFPLSELAGEVLGAVRKELSRLDDVRGHPDYHQGDSRVWHSLAWEAVEPSVREFADALRAKLAREGGEANASD